MMVRKWEYWLLLAVLFSVLTSSCEHKDLGVPSTELQLVKIDFDYSDVEQTPEAMRVLFFPVEARSVYKFDLPDSGGYVRVPAGDYQVIAYNIDTETVIEASEESYGDFELTTHSYVVENDDEPDEEIGFSRSLFGSNVPKGRGEGSFLLYDNPEWTCGSRVEHFRVNRVLTTVVTTRAEGGEQPEGQQLTLRPTTEVCVVNLTAEGIEGVEYATMVRGTLSGVAAGRYIAMGVPSPEAGMVSFAGLVDREAKVIRSTFLVWDYTPAGSSGLRQYLNLYIWTNGGNYYMSTDVTDLLERAENSKVMEVDITLKLDLSIMDDESGGNSGFRPRLDEWEEHHSSMML